MPQQVTELLEVLNSNSNVTISLNGDSADIIAGGDGSGGELILRNDVGTELARVDGQTGEIIIRDNSGNPIARIDGPNGVITLQSATGDNRIRLLANEADGFFGGNGSSGTIALFRGTGDNQTLGQATIRLDGSGGNVFCGGDGRDGDLVLRNGAGLNRIRLDADGANGWFGGNGEEGNILLFDGNGDNASTSRATIHLNGGTGDIRCGGDGRDGDIILRSSTGQNRIRLDATGANGWFGGNGEEGNILLFDNNGDNTTSGNATIHLNGGTGDIIFQNADCAEDFDVIQEEDVEPGMVMVMHEDGALHPCAEAYDRRVAGVISGAGAYKPGLVLDRYPSETPRMPVALMGKVYCFADATYGPINIGDRLTTSPTPGHAMLASDAEQASGAVIGKALGGIESGTGMIPVLVTLQ